VQGPPAPGHQKPPSPTPDAALERQTVTVYEDEGSQSLFVVYAPTEGKQLKFVCMTLLPFV
jgi:hypothetical protein